MKKNNIGCIWYIIWTFGAVLGIVFAFCKFAPDTARSTRNEIIESVFGVTIEKRDSVVTLPKIEVEEPKSVTDDNYVVIPIEMDGNITYVFAEVNGVKIRFILDTGCTDIQMTVAEFYTLKHMGLVTDSDLGEKVVCTYANGEEGECHTFNIKSLKIGGIEVNDINCTVEENIDGPLLLGQTVLQKLGEVTIDYNNKTIKIRKLSTTTT